MQDVPLIRNNDDRGSATVTCRLASGNHKADSRASRTFSRQTLHGAHHRNAAQQRPLRLDHRDMTFRKYPYAEYPTTKFPTDAHFYITAEKYIE
jgi:hypothetical protein